MHGSSTFTQALHLLLTEYNILPFFSLSTSGVGVEQVGHFDDGVSQAIHITEGFPFGSKIHNLLYVRFSIIIGSI